jgi:hypothetical protein
MYYNICSLETLYKNMHFKENACVKTKNLLYNYLEKLLPNCVLYKIDIDKFIEIAYNNIITQLNIIIENDNDLLKIPKIENNVTNLFHNLFINIWVLNLRKYNTYNDVLHYTALKLYEFILRKHDNINFLIHK